MGFISECTSGGCGAKIGPGELSAILNKLPVFDAAEELLVGYDTSDDAAVYKISDTEAIISTVDFFSPMVDDPRIFGRIAAANALSDVYAMGGDVLFALNLVCFPQKMDKEILSEILTGGSEKIIEAGAVLSGGHSIYDHEPKYGMAVTGKANLKNILRNNTCRPGDLLIITKALGTGLVMSADRVGLSSPETRKTALDSMQRLNKYAAEKIKKYQFDDPKKGVSACTDITGFGLLSHLNEMAGEKNTILVDTSLLPIIPDALKFAEEYLATAAGQRNRNFLKDSVDVSYISPAVQEILFDPQTSGGLIISVSSDVAEDLLRDIKEDDPLAEIIGQVQEREDSALIIQ